MLTVSAYAKINLTLEIIGKRDDGYHEISSVMQTIDLTDELSFEPADKLIFDCESFPGIRTDYLEEVIMRAAETIRSETGYLGGAIIKMEQLNIPRASGFGSSSTDSAAVLKGLNELWSLELSNDKLVALASRLGSDTPFFIHGGTALAEGRGEEVTPLPSFNRFQVLIVVPNTASITNKTARMYAALSQSHYTDRKKSNALVFNLLNNRQLSFDMLSNSFENVVHDVFPEIDEYRRICFNAGIDHINLAGSGPALFSILPETTDSSVILNKLHKEGIQFYMVNTI